MTKPIRRVIFFIVVTALCINVAAQNKRAECPRVLISTDIGGTDPDDNQSFIHLLMYSDMFDIEGLISSPSYGKGSVGEMNRMISVYEKDYPKLIKHAPKLMHPDSLRAVCKQGTYGLAPYCGYKTPTEGSEWIVKVARKKSDRKLWILVWGTLEDVAQALHDAPDIEKNIRVYYIGGPNKKWGVNSYAYIAEHHPDLWMIENNSTYRGLITESKNADCYNTGFYNYAMRGSGCMGADFINYYGGIVKMGDTPSLLYMMDGNPEDPTKECWGGRFMKTRHSARRMFYDKQLTVKDTVPVYSVMELYFSVPSKIARKSNDTAKDSAAFTITIDNQQWNGEYVANGVYSVRYSPKAPGRLTYRTSSSIEEFNNLTGEFTVCDNWPGEIHKNDYTLGNHWYTDLSDRGLYEGKWQGAKCIRKHREVIMENWAERWRWLRY